jgi:hypothetical protein
MSTEEFLKSLHDNHKLIMIILHISMVIVLILIVYGYFSMVEIPLKDVYIACYDTCQKSFGTYAIGYKFDGTCMCDVRFISNITG